MPPRTYFITEDQSLTNPWEVKYREDGREGYVGGYPTQGQAEAMIAKLTGAEDTPSEIQKMAATLIPGRMYKRVRRTKPCEFVSVASVGQHRIKADFKINGTSDLVQYAATLSCPFELIEDEIPAVHVGRKYRNRHDGAIITATTDDQGYGTLTSDGKPSISYISGEEFLRHFELVEEDAVSEASLEVEVGDTLRMGEFRSKVLKIDRSGRYPQVQIDRWPGYDFEGWRGEMEIYAWLATGAMTLEKKREPRVWEKSFIWAAPLVCPNGRSYGSLSEGWQIQLERAHPFLGVPCDVTITMKERI